MLANILSLSRIALAFPLLYSLRRGDDITATTVALLLLAAATDLGDGFVARRLGQVSRTGKTLDPLSDKVFLTCLLGGLVVWGNFPAWLLAMLLLRDLVIVAAGTYLLRSRGFVIAANRWGKSTTACMGFTTLSFVVHAPSLLSDILVAASAALVVVSSVVYARAFRHVLSGMDAADIY